MPATSPQFTILKAARLIDTARETVQEQAAILLEDDIVRQVGTAETVRAPDDAPVREIDYGDATILPGLVDSHVHLNGIGDGRAGDDLALLPDEVLTVQAAENARKHLYSGVTTLRDCGAKHRTTFLLRQAVELGIVPAPRLILAGRPIAIIGGHLGYFGTTATGVDECRAAVRQLIKEGADFIKVTATGGSTRTSDPLRPSFDVSELLAICTEAHRFGMHSAAHCTSSQGMVNSLDAGIDTILHAVHKEPDGADTYHPEISERIVEQGVFVNPTLGQAVARIRMLEDMPSLTSEQQAELDAARQSSDARMDHFARMRDAGVVMAAGSDSAWAHYPMGDYQTDIEAHAMAGMSNMEAIVSATRDAARSCCIDAQVGTLEPGKQADALVVVGNPLDDLSALRDVADVYLAGVRVDRQNFV
ncbi:MAG: amidohydrolase family protein [Chloroflexi bacterium]|nr:amidohydrolase family protein [Chloroflexota bacterium]